jgi:hypothetical protein
MLPAMTPGHVLKIQRAAAPSFSSVSGPVGDASVMMTIDGRLAPRAHIYTAATDFLHRMRQPTSGA